MAAPANAGPDIGPDTTDAAVPFALQHLPSRRAVWTATVRVNVTPRVEVVAPKVTVVTNVWRPEIQFDPCRVAIADVACGCAASSVERPPDVRDVSSVTRGRKRTRRHIRRLGQLGLNPPVVAVVVVVASASTPLVGTHRGYRGSEVALMGVNGHADGRRSARDDSRDPKTWRLDRSLVQVVPAQRSTTGSTVLAVR